MSRPRVAVIQFPGSNCEHETATAVERAGMEAAIFRWNRDADELGGFDGFILPGGFSYQDRVRAGAIAAKKTIMRRIISAAADGAPVLGICNGAQVLVETGMIPGGAGRGGGGRPTGRIDMALAPNVMEGRSGFYCDWAHVRPSGRWRECAFLASLSADKPLPIPIAHGEGRFTTTDDSVASALGAEGRIVLQYCTAGGEVADGFPTNPNGSLAAAAGICNERGNVMALMPHPERVSFLRQVPDDLGDVWSERKVGARGDSAAMAGPGPGLALFESMRDYIRTRAGRA